MCVHRVKQLGENVTGAMNTAKNEIFIALYYEHCYLVGEG